MSRPLLALNALLLAASVYFGVELFHLWTTPAPREVPTAHSPAAAPAALATGAVAAQKAGQEGARSRPSGPTFAAIAEKNLFSPNRTEVGPPPITVTPGMTPTGAMAPAPAPAPAPPLPKPFLNGVVILESGAVAYMEDATTKRVAAYRVGDALAGGTVESIGADHVVLDRPSGKLEIRLRDPSKPRQAVLPQAPTQPRRPPAGAPPQVESAPVTPAVPPGRPLPPNLLRRMPSPPSGDAPQQ
jgi:hypothetical protein